ncbi:MAG: protein kinase [Halioglobus sp.]
MDPCNRDADKDDGEALLMANFEITGYELYELLGRGGMATVYRALHLNLDREVAIKVMDTSLNADESFSERFIREARISAQLVHPHILQIYDVNSYDTLNYISMELLEGGDLADIIRGDMKQSSIYMVTEQMTEALDYAAAKGYVHRDIKPSNIMLRDANDYVLADFGIAKAANSGTQMTQTGLMVGTPSYMSPEQAKGIEVDGRSDLYSLAVLCYEMLTKELPYDSDSAVSTAVKHLTEDIPTLPEHLAPYQPFLDKALAKNADDRYQSGREMYRGFCEVRNQFDEDAVLTAGKEPKEKTRTGGSGLDENRTSIADSHTSIGWNDSTMVSSPRGSSRPYKLSDTSPREPLISGIRSRQAQGRRPGRPMGSTGFRLFSVVIIVGAAAFGGYKYWQGQEATSAGDLRSMTSELAKAYNALNEENLQRAATAFNKVLQIDSGHAAARQGMDEVETQYVNGIEAALAENDLIRANQMITDYSLMFPTSNNVERFQLSIRQSREDSQLQSVQLERVAILLENAEVALAGGRLFEPENDSAYAYLRQARELEGNNMAVNEGFHRLMDQALAAVSDLIDRVDFVTARGLLDQVRAIDEGYPALQDIEVEIGRAEQAELLRQERWANYSEDKKQTIIERLAVAEDLLAKGLLTSAEQTTPGENAYDYFLAVLELDPENESALRGPGRVARAYMAMAEQAVAANDFERAELLLQSASVAAPDYKGLMQQRNRLDAARVLYAEGAAIDARVAEILDQAEAEMANSDKGLVYVDRATDFYHQALEIDSGNSSALAGLEEAVNIYLSRADESVAYGEFSAAITAINKARSLAAPDRIDFDRALAELDEKEAQWLTGQNVSVLLESGKELASAGDYSAAADKFSTALKLDSANAQGSESLAAAIEAIYQRAKTGIEFGDFTSASDDLIDAAELAPEREDIRSLQLQLPELEQAWSEQQNLNEAIAEAQALYQKGHLSKAADAYLRLMQEHSDLAEARDGFSKSIAALVRHAQTSVDKGDFEKARRSLNTVTSLAPDDKPAAKLLAQLPGLEQEYQRQQAAVAQAREEAMLLANAGLDAVVSGDLDMAANSYSQLAAGYPQLPETLRLKNQLLSAYVEATRQGISSGNFDDAEAYLSRGQELAPGYGAWSELEEEIAVSRNSSRRRLGAY